MYLFPHIISVSTLEDEETLRSRVVHQVEELEASRLAVGQPVPAATVDSLVYQALATKQPDELVQRILCLMNKSSAPTSTDTTGLDASIEVAELRKLKEEVVREKKGLATSQPPTKDGKGKNNGTKLPRSLQQTLKFFNLGDSVNVLL